MGNSALRSRSGIPQSEERQESNEGRSASQLRIGWQIPAHLFIEQTGESLCGQASDRQSMSIAEVQDYTSPLMYPLNRLRDKEQVLHFAEGICENCLRSYYSSHQQKTDVNHLDVYSEDINLDAQRSPMGFCYTCGFQVKPEECEIAKVGSKYPVYACDECSLRTFANITEAFNQTGATDENLSTLSQRLQDQLSKTEW
jgi:hypothetical protein